MGPSRLLLFMLARLGGPRDTCTCPGDHQCVQWALDYLGDCVCDFKDMVSLSLGLASVFCWAVAEIPQIIANFIAGSTDGVSLTFLLTWTVGDVFNLAGCMLEPATLPTQLYMAVMYTINTLILVIQSVYYELVLPPKEPKVVEVETEAEGPSQPLLTPPTEQGGLPVSTGAQAVPPVGVPVTSAAPLVIVASATATEEIQVPLSRKTSTRNIHISSARSLASSHTPSMGSFLPGSLSQHPPLQGSHHVGSLLSQSPGQGHPHISLRSSLPRTQAPSLTAMGGPPPPATQGFSPAAPAGGQGTGPSSSQGRTTSLRAVVSLGMFLSLGLFAGLNDPSAPAALARTVVSSASPALSRWHPAAWHPRNLLSVGSAAHMHGRLLLAQDSAGEPRGALTEQQGVDTAQAALREGGGESKLGEVLGWLMAAIYMGGRIPQIILNVQRGSVEGLSPLMFLFALLGNVTYVGSILVRNTAWDVIRPNLAWIVDAGVCVLLDIFILGQFVYYSLNPKKEPNPMDLLEDR